jgi:hypothetical protein
MAVEPDNERIRRLNPHVDETQLERDWQAAKFILGL